MSDSIFTKIIKGEIPSHKVYEDDKTYAFMDIHPIQPGHVLVVTKTPAETFLDLSEEDAVAFWSTIRKVGQKLRDTFPKKRRIGLMIEGLDVAHAHAKVFPVDTGEEYRHLPDENAEPDHVALAEMAKKLSF
jgi:histidine triad (HIT) family protein